MSDEPPQKKRKDAAQASITTKSGGAYIPPAKLRLMQQQITDKNSEQYQRLSWEALKKSINGLINKVNVSNIKEIATELFQENIVRGRGVLARSVMLAQNASPTFTHVYASFTAIINSRFPQNGELILRRVVAQFRRSYRRNLKDTCLHSVQFIGHLINQQVAHEILGLQILTLLLETATDDSVEVAVGFLKECGQKLGEVSPRGLSAVFERLRHILHEQQLDKRVQYMIEVMFAIRKDGFKEHPAVIEDLDLVDEGDQFTHMLTIDDDNVTALETQLNVFRLDPEFEKTEENYKQIKKDILDGSSEGSGSSSGGSSSDESSDEGEEEAAAMEIKDKTETNLVALRRTVYLAIQSSLSYEECAHKILKMEFGEQDYPEICAMVVDCCSQLRTYEKFFGLLGGRFCLLKKEFMESFEKLFAEQYETIHRLETNKLRNVAKFFAHLLHSDALPWSVLANIALSEDTTTSSSRIFIKILFLEITEYLGITKLNERLKDPTLAPFFEGLFPRDNPQNTRFAINFFTSIGLGGITDDLREHLKTTALLMSQKIQEEQLAALNVDSSSSDESSDSDDSSASEKKSKKKKKTKKSKKKKKSSSKVKKDLKKKESKHKKKRKPSMSSSSPESEDASSSDANNQTQLKSTVTMVQNKVEARQAIRTSDKSSDEQSVDQPDSPQRSKDPRKDVHEERDSREKRNRDDSRRRKTSPDLRDARRDKYIDERDDQKDERYRDVQSDDYSKSKSGNRGRETYRSGRSNEQSNGDVRQTYDRDSKRNQSSRGDRNSSPYRQRREPREEPAYNERREERTSRRSRSATPPRSYRDENRDRDQRDRRARNKDDSLQSSYRNDSKMSSRYRNNSDDDNDRTRYRTDTSRNRTENSRNTRQQSVSSVDSSGDSASSDDDQQRYRERSDNRPTVTSRR